MLFLLSELADQIIKRKHDEQGVDVVELVAGVALLNDKHVGRCDFDIFGEPVAEAGIKTVLVKDVWILAHGLTEL